MTPSQIKTLNDISNSLLFIIRTEGLNTVLDNSSSNQYREDWKRISVRKELLEPWRGNLDVDIEKMSVEVISTDVDMSHEAHYHKDAYAIVTILGESEGVEEPAGARFCFGTKEWLPAQSGITLQFTPSKVHGFTSGNGAKPIVFLSVQSVKIDTDYHLAN